MEFYLTSAQRPRTSIGRADGPLPAARKSVVSPSPSTRPTEFRIRCSRTSRLGANCRTWTPTRWIHEDGPAQMEINFRHGGDARRAWPTRSPCSKRTMREAAAEDDDVAKPRLASQADHRSAGQRQRAHITQSVVDVKTGTEPVLQCRRHHERDCSAHHIGVAAVVHPRGAAAVRAERPALFRRSCRRIPRPA